jgi:hypothetical protein
MMFHRLVGPHFGGKTGKFLLEQRVKLPTPSETVMERLLPRLATGISK